MIDDSQVLRTLDEKVRPEWTALLIVDMVNDLVHPEGKAATLANRPLDHVEEVQPNIERLLRLARQAGAMIVHIQHTTLESGIGLSGPWVDVRSRATHGLLEFCMEGTWGHQVIDELAPEPGEAVVQKLRYSGFVGTDLDLVLRSADRQTVVISGVSTNVCVEATARDALSHDYYTVLPGDACASWSRHLHDASLETAGHRYATVCTVNDLATAWELA